MPETLITNPQPTFIAGGVTATSALQGQRWVELFCPNQSNVANAITTAVTQGGTTGNFAPQGGIAVSITTATSTTYTTAASLVTAGVLPGMQILATTSAIATTLGLPAPPLWVESIATATTFIGSAAATATAGPAACVAVPDPNGTLTNNVPPLALFQTGDLVSYQHGLLTSAQVQPLIPELAPNIAAGATQIYLAGVALNQAFATDTVQVCTEGPALARVNTAPTVGQFVIQGTTLTLLPGGFASIAGGAAVFGTTIGICLATGAAGTNQLIVVAKM